LVPGKVRENRSGILPLKSLFQEPNMTRPSQRQADQLRDVRITRNFTCHAEGSVLVEFGNTTVLCAWQG